MASSSSSGPLLARGISHGGIAGATVGAFLGATFLFLLFLPFILRAIRETRYRRRISSDNAEMGYAGASSVAYGADREPYHAPFHPLPPVATQPGGFSNQPGQFGLQTPPTTYYPGGTLSAGPTTAPVDSSLSETGKAQNGLTSAPSSEPARQTAGPADAQPDAAAPTPAAAAHTAPEAPATAEASAAASAVSAPTADAAPSASQKETTTSDATPSESAAPAAPAAAEASTALEASQGSGAPAAPAVSSPVSDGPPAASSLSGRSPAVAPINTALAQGAAASVSADQMRTPPPLARGVAATFPAFHAQQPSPPYQPRQRSATMRSTRSRRSPSLLDRAAALFRSNSSRVELTRGPPGGREGPDLSRSPLAVGFRDIDGPDHHSWLMTEQGVRIEPEIPGHSVFEVDLNNLSGLSAEYYSEGPLSPPIDSSYLMYPSSYAATPPSALASSLASMATAGALVGVATGPERQPTASEAAPQANNSLQLPTAGKKPTDKAVSPLPPSPTSPSPFMRTKFSAANGDRVGWMEDVQEEPHEEVQTDSASRKGSASSTSAAATSVRGERTPDPAEFMRSPSHLTLVPSPRLPAPGTVNPRDVWAPATDDERFVHKTAELDRIEQTPPAGPMEAAACFSTASAATSSPSAHESDGGVGSVSGTSGTSGMSGMSGISGPKPYEEIDPVVVPDELRQSTEVSEPSESGAPFIPELQRISMPTPEQIGTGMSPAPQMKRMPAPATQQPTFQVTTPDSFESGENYGTPEVYESPEDHANWQQNVQSQQSQIYGTQPDSATLTYYSSPTGVQGTVGAGAQDFSSGPASASAQPSHAPAHAPMPVSTHDAPAPAMAHVSAPMDGTQGESYTPALANNNNNNNLFQQMVPQTFSGDFNFNYNLDNQGGYVADNMYPSLLNGKMPDFAMVQQPNDAQFYWPMPGNLSLMPEQPYTSPGTQGNGSGLYYPGQAFGQADAMLYQHHGGSAGAQQHLPFQTPQSSPGYASAGYSDDSAVQMQSLPSATSSSGAAPIGKPVSPPMAKLAGQPFAALSVPGADGVTQPLSPSSQGSTPSQTNATVPRGFTCDECGRSFDQIHKLNHHKRYHERPHECTVSGCGKRFGTKTHLDRHFNDKHSKSRKYHCTEEGCPYSVVGGKSFPRKDNWRRHMVNKHGVQPEHEPIEVVDVPMMGMPV